MDNCLKTQLKSVVDNNNLLKVNECRFYAYITNPSGSFYLHVPKGSEAKVRIANGPTGAKMSVRGVLYDGEFTISRGESIALTETGNYELRIQNYYVIDEISMTKLGENKVSFNTEFLKWMRSLSSVRISVFGKCSELPASLTGININNSPYYMTEQREFTGDIDSIPSKNSASLFQLLRTNCTGSINSLASNTVLTRLALENAGNISGDLNSLLNKPLIELISLVNTEVEGNINILIKNGALTLPNLTELNIHGSSKIIASDEDIATLRSLGVTVSV